MHARSGREPDRAIGRHEAGESRLLDLGASLEPELAIGLDEPTSLLGASRAEKGERGGKQGCGGRDGRSRQRPALVSSGSGVEELVVLEPAANLEDREGVSGPLAGRDDDGLAVSRG